MPSRNDACPCGSGRKYKRCCLGADQDQERAHPRLVDAVTTWTEDQFPGQIAASIAEFFGDRKEATAQETNFAASWFLHDRDLPGGETPLEHYAIEGPDGELRVLAGLMSKAKLRLWRVIESAPSDSIVLEPFMGGERALVRSANISAVVGPWDLILGRLRPDVMELWGPSRCFAVHEEDTLRHTLERLARETDVDPEDVDQVARRAPAELLNLPRTELIPLTTEGDPVRCVTARWHVGKNVALAAFDATPELIPEGSFGAPSFGWLAPRAELRALAPDTLPPGAVTFESNPIGMSDAVAIGTFYVERDGVRYDGVSERRLAWALELIADTLPSAEFVETESKTFEQLRREQPDQPSLPPDVPPEVIAELRAEMTERWLSEPVPALEGLTPRQAASRGAYRPQLRSLLRGIAALSRNDLAIDIDTVVADIGIRP